MTQASIHSPIGDLTIFEDNGFIVALDWGWGSEQGVSELLDEAKKQLHEYFDGNRTGFDLPLKPDGTPFQQKTWTALQKISYGQIKNYGQIAKQLNSHARAVGGACGKNPIPIIIPCHRVLAKDGSLGGYSGDGGVTTKSQLLVLEGYEHPRKP
jgi:methylated-DNA-[protein]-cysteine S-methyltransferase